jgi:GPH family glycoside/pentoside/hexuronide:cation symporter/glucuronide carrier protein
MASVEGYLFAAFLTDYAQFSLVIVGQIMLITSLVDIACALAAGFVLQRTTLRFGGKYRSWFLIGPPIIAPLYVLQYTRIGSDVLAASIIILCFIASHLLWNVVYTATGSMVGRLSQIPEERTILSASRAQGLAAALLIFSATALPMITYFAARTNKVTGFTITVGLYALLMISGYLHIYKITAGRDPYNEEAAVTQQPLSETMALVFRNPHLLFLVLAEIFRNGGGFVIAGFAFYYFAYVLKDLSFYPVFLLGLSIARVVGTLAAPWIGVNLGKRKCYSIFLVLAAAGFASAKFLGKTDLTFTAIFCVASFAVTIPFAMSTALFSDTVIYGEWKTGKNIRAFTMALLTFPIKVGIFFRSAVIAIGLPAIGFVANETPAPGVVDGISSIMTFTPAAAYALAAAVFYFGYKIEEQQVVRMQHEIDGRKMVEPVRA